MNGLYDLYEFRINLQILNEKVKSAAPKSLKMEETLSLRCDRMNFEQGMIALTDKKNGKRGDTPRDETVQSTLKAIEEKGRYFFSNPVDANIISGTGYAFFNTLDEGFYSKSIWNGMG